MREFAIGDIHGCARSFHALLEILQPEATDTIILLGDYIDRGPDSRNVIETILDLNKTCTVVALTGNHEKMILRARYERDAYAIWMASGGEATLDSYADQWKVRTIDAIPDRHWTFFADQTLPFWETNERIFVHGSVDPELEMREQPDYQLYWERFSNPTVHQSGKPIVCGHASQKSGLPAIFNKGICIDTWACGGGWLTGLDTIQSRFTQTNERGERRTFDLPGLVALGSTPNS